MSTKALLIRLDFGLVAVLVFFGTFAQAAPLGSAFTYQGTLSENGQPAHGLYDLRFELHATESGGSPLGQVTAAATGVTGGVFTVTLDFGSGAFNGDARWVAVYVRTNDSDHDHEALWPRQKLLPVPYALFASSAGAANLAAVATTANSVANQSVSANGIASGQVVKSLNNLRDSVTLAPGANLTVTSNGQTLTLASPADWHLAGNAGIAPGTHFLGTTDSQPLDFRVNNTRGWRLEPTAGGSVNVLGGTGSQVAGTVFGATIGGGVQNRVEGDANVSTIAGGQLNTVRSWMGSIGGGDENTIETNAFRSTIAGGVRNVIRSGAGNSVISGGWANSIGTNSFSSTISGGAQQRIEPNSEGATIMGGAQNSISNAPHAVVLGGRQNVAAGANSLVAGFKAQALHGGSFVFSDTSSQQPFHSGNSNQFLIRANGGVGIGTNQPQAALHVAGTVRADSFSGSGAALSNLSGAALADRSITAAKFAPGAFSHLDAPDGSPLNALQVNTNGFVGIGTFAPEAALHIASGMPVLQPALRSRMLPGSPAFSNIQGRIELALSGALLAVGSSVGYDASALTLVNLTNPAAPALLWSITNGTGPYTNLGLIDSLALSGHLLAVAGTMSDAVTLIDITNPSAPVFRSCLRDGVGGFTNLSRASSVVFAGDLLAIAAWADSAVTLVDVSNPALPVLRATIMDGDPGYPDLGGARRLACRGHLLAVASYPDDAVTLIDISNPSAPRWQATLKNGVGSFTNLAGAMAVAFSGNLLAIGALKEASNNNAVTLVDVANPAAPRWLAVLRDDEGGWNDLSYPLALRFAGNILWIAGYSDNALTLVDVSNPTSPIRKAVLKDGLPHPLPYPASLALSGDTMVVGSDAGVAVFNASSTQNVSVAAAGWVGIGTSTPLAPLHVQGDVLVANASLATINAERVQLGESAALGRYSTAMGSATATGHHSTALGTSEARGVFSTAMGSSLAGGFASVAIGSRCSAMGDYSFALGSHAQAMHDHSLVWADVELGENRPVASTGPKQFLIQARGGVGIGAAPEDAALDVEGDMHLNDFDLFLRGGSDRNHGLGWYGQGKVFAGRNLDGPVLYGCDGGGLGTACGTPMLALTWDQTGKLAVDPGSLNTGALTPGLTFGQGSGEGIASKRNSGGNQYGLDFYTSFNLRMSIAQNGNVGLGRQPTANRLEVEGNASKVTAGSWLANSDARIKQDIATITNALDTLAKVRLVRFRYAEDYRQQHPSIEDRTYLNVVAQEFKKVFPESVQESGERLPDGDSLLQADTYPLTIYSAAAVQELQQQLKAKDQRLADLEQRLERIERLLNQNSPK